MQPTYKTEAHKKRVGDVILTITNRTPIYHRDEKATVKQKIEQQLYEIFCLMVKKKFKYDDELLPCAKDYFLGLSDNVIGAKDFANARFVRNLFERTWGKASSRMQFTNQEEIVLTKDDFVRATSEKEFNVSKKKREIGFH